MPWTHEGATNVAHPGGSQKLLDQALLKIREGRETITENRPQYVAVRRKGQLLNGVRGGGEAHARLQGVKISGREKGKQMVMTRRKVALSKEKDIALT